MILNLLEIKMKLQNFRLLIGNSFHYVAKKSFSCLFYLTHSHCNKLQNKYDYIMLVFNFSANEAKERNMR